jgi:hypothetical protein
MAEGELSTWRVKADGGLVVLRWFGGGVLCATDGAPSRRNPSRHRGKRRGMALLVGCGKSKQSGAGEREREWGKEEEKKGKWASLQLCSG